MGLHKMKYVSLNKMQKQYEDCTACLLHKYRKHVVFGHGKVTAKYMIIGEGPGRQEDIAGLPFVGQAGHTLDRLVFDELAFDPDDFYICNVVCCKPKNNRDPKPAEAEACNDRLLKQVLAIRPEAIFTLGKISSNWIVRNTVKTTEMKPIGSMIDWSFRFNGYETVFRRGAAVHKTKVFCSYHPSYLDRKHSAALEAQFKDLFVRGIIF